ncbi:response regulator [Sulfurimonas sp.]|uniref:response regulator n=1 Tax=Sulfurimonas sp. TaxID=2022749 RepID=UPI0025F1EE2A|nr:response regulator [Sulfurimonas sp.]
MKIFFLLTFLLTLLFSNQTQIVLGSFSTKQAAIRVKEDIQKIINKDAKFKNFIEQNSLKTKYKQHGKYIIVTIEPFNDIVTTHSVLNRLKKNKYKDAYKLSLSSKKDARSIPTVQELEIIDDPLLMPEPSLEVVKSVQETKIKPLKNIKKDLVLKENISPRQEAQISVFKAFKFEMITAIAFLTLIVIYFLLKKSKQKIEDDITDITPIPKKEDFEEDFEEENLEDLYDVEETEESQEPIVMQERAESISFDIFDKEEKVNTPIRHKRKIKAHDKITKENFKEFAGKRILVAEDNMINQKVITGLLADSGIEISMADDGQFLLEILEKDSNYNFILMDAHMPRVDGFEATRKIRSNPDYDHIVIIALSGDTASDDITKMTDAGMEEHLEKPLRMEALYEILYAYSDSEEVIVDNLSELDADKGLSICAYDLDFYHEILNEFMKTYKDSSVKLQEFLDNNEIEKADRYLLDMSGIAANIGADGIRTKALGLKKAIENLKDRRYFKLIEEYTKSLYNLLDEIKKYKERT